MKTRIENNVYIYEFHLPNGEITTLYADDKKRTYESEYNGRKVKGNVSNTCSEGTLSTIFEGVSELGQLEIKTITAKDGNQLNIEFSVYLNNTLHEKVEETCSQAAFW